MIVIIYCLGSLHGILAWHWKDDWKNSLILMLTMIFVLSGTLNLMDYYAEA